MLVIKNGVNFADLKPEIVRAAWEAEKVYAQELELPFVVTAGRDGKHMAGSKHYDGAAIDARSKTVPREKLERVWNLLKLRIGLGYDIILEGRDGPNEHFHIEWDPKE